MIQVRKTRFLSADLGILGCWFPSFGGFWPSNHAFMRWRMANGSVSIVPVEQYPYSRYEAYHVEPVYRNNATWSELPRNKRPPGAPC